ncbi:hypothetical protein C8R43DRAFT_1140618 [Mycena crocata]|nr:hypothetical protein C8R43DRAFT_1140618 [Mycena crocata]
MVFPHSLVLILILVLPSFFLATAFLAFVPLLIALPFPFATTNMFSAFGQPVPAAPAAAPNDTALPVPSATVAPPNLPLVLVSLLPSLLSGTMASKEDVSMDGWYVIMCGCFVGVVDQFALADIAITGVGHSACKAYTTQQLALKAFNKALKWGGVQVV